MNSKDQNEYKTPSFFNYYPLHTEVTSDSTYSKGNHSVHLTGRYKPLPNETSSYGKETTIKGSNVYDNNNFHEVLSKFNVLVYN